MGGISLWNHKHSAKAFDGKSKRSAKKEKIVCKDNQEDKIKKITFPNKSDQRRVILPLLIHTVGNPQDGQELLLRIDS